MAHPRYKLSDLEILIFGLTPFVALTGMLWLAAYTMQGELWNGWVILSGTVEVTLVVWSCPWRLTALSGLLTAAGLAAVGGFVWLPPLLACVTSVVLFGLACALGARRDARRRARAKVLATPWW